MEPAYTTYIYSYEFDGEEWSFEVKAKDLAEAKRRVMAIRAARLDGELVGSVPVSGGRFLEWLAKWWFVKR